MDTKPAYSETGQFEYSEAFARSLDKNDPLSSYRERFYIPPKHGSESLYFCGNSLGCQPRSVKEYLIRELDHWKEYGVEGHFEGEHPWMYYHKFLLPQTAAVVGAKESEVVVMNTLTTNLHLMLVSFYQPSGDRYRIMMEGGAFPSDQYALESQVRFHGYEPDDAIIELHPRPGEHTLREEDIIQAIHEHGDSLSLILFGGVNYYSGQFFPMERMSAAAHKVGAMAGFDLAHAAGNIPLSLHDWNVDFAVWCSYKYLNSGPGGPSGVFVHERHGDRPELPRFAGWWGHDESARFKMEKGFIPMEGAAGWQLSNAQILSFAAHWASLDIFHEVGMEALRVKSLKLTGFLEFGLNVLNRQGKNYQVITPTNPSQRGCQLSILTGDEGKDLYDYLNKHGVICDWREPNVIRLAPVPLYNSFLDVFRFLQLLERFDP